jgi:hypothetical protein
MAKQYIKIELDENDIKEMISEKYGLEHLEVDINIEHYFDAKEQSPAVRIIVTSDLAVLEEKFRKKMSKTI